MTPGLPADPARELSRLPRPRLLAATVGIVAILSGLRLVQVVSLSSRRLVTEDAATLWLAGHDMLNGQLRQPTFPGQHYGVPFEGLGPLGGGSR
jgi:hypothetical protein